jgi:hypothetical protein
MKRSHTIILLVVAAISAAGYLLYNQMTTVSHEINRSKALEGERNELWDRIGTLEKNVADLEEELALHKEPAVPEKKLTEVFGKVPTDPLPEQKQVDCTTLENSVKAVFSYLDTREYIKEYALDGGMYGLCREIATELAQKPPSVTEEMKDMVSLARNVAHFYRVLGQKRIDLLKDVMAKESDIMETLMATFYLWFTVCSHCDPTASPCPCLETLYEYAGFFLNTLAGKSYLLRRDSKMRVLVTYYSVLVLDQANRETLNRHGIDIRPFARPLFEDIRNQKGLMYKEQYLTRLRELNMNP